MHCKPMSSMVPRHIYSALAAELLHAKRQAVPGQRIVRGTFVIHHVEALLDAVCANYSALDQKDKK